MLKIHSRVRNCENSDEYIPTKDWKKQAAWAWLLKVNFSFPVIIYPFVILVNLPLREPLIFMLCLLYYANLEHQLYRAVWWLQCPLWQKKATKLSKFKQVVYTIWIVMNIFIKKMNNSSGNVLSLKIGLVTSFVNKLYLFPQKSTGIAIWFMKLVLQTQKRVCQSL